MRITAFLLLAAALQVSARGFSQTLTLSLKHANLEKVFVEIEKQTGFSFIYLKEQLSEAHAIDLEANNESLEAVLQKLFAGQPLTYHISGKYIAVRKKETTAPDEAAPPGEIHGRVTNEQGQPLANANVIIKRTGRGTITNAKGEFSLRDAKPNDLIVISYIGLKTLRITPGAQTDLTLVMEVAKDELDKVVVQAYGTTTQRLATGNIATVTAEQIERHPVMNVIEALQGQVPGVVIQQTSGFASAPFKVEIRGRNSINENFPSDPLYIIDGVPLTIVALNNQNGPAGGNYGSGSTGFIQNGMGGPANGQSPFFSVNPNDIESVTVLKDADATAIYGSRGAKGVIIITTKKGKPGKAKLSLDIYSGASKVTGHYDLMNLREYLDMRYEAFRNDGKTYDAGNAYDLVLWDTTRYTDWQKIAFGHIGRTNDVEASLSGGDKLTTFRVAANYHRQTGILTYSGADQRGSVQFNLSRKSIDQRFSLSFTSFYSYAKTDMISIGAASLLPPNAPSDIFDKNGNLNYNAWRPIAYMFPFANVLQPYSSSTSFLNSQLTLQYELLKGLTASGNFGYSTNHVSQIQVYPIAALDPYTNPKGSAVFGNNNGANTIIEPQLEYKRNIARGKFSAIIGGSIQTSSQDANSVSGSEYTNDALLRSVGNAPKKSADNSSGMYKYAALFGRINYNWNDKYIVNLSLRRDGSSRFGPGRQFGNFGSVGAAWIFTEENFFRKHLSFLSYGKIRGSYGHTGNDQVGDYQYLTQWTSNPGYAYIYGIPAYIPGHLANKDYQWEVNRKLEFALRLGFLNNRLSVEASWYRNRCYNQLVRFPLSGITGFGDVIANSPAGVQNMGIEVVIQAKIVDSRDWAFSINLNAGRNYNKLLSYPNIDRSPYSSTLQIGKPLNLVSIFKYTGVDPQTGLYSFEDVNKDGVLLANPLSKRGDYHFREQNILLDGGMGADLRYKQWQLNLFFTGRVNPFLKNDAFNGAPGGIGNQSRRILDRWRKPGDQARFARFQSDFSQNFGNFTQSDASYTNGSYIRLRNLSLAYDMPARLIQKMAMQGCRIYFHAENVFVISKFDGIDPDVPSVGGLPPAKVFTGGIQINF